ncbi:hypothetical protein GYMLUDRAFT_49073 [Collybiopsis luxurians FD-317 M1]|uniref:Uncharacterized protein n=1 Tax=Collybiopsis luxurians FD-317 M1 TaxID=944289 RepID=A0A0D0BWH1_9AGAR|nr:hypothetical protein GYMLUDRAFT_49073 [Collybiopsis luxurians FD-317 M1]
MMENVNNLSKTVDRRSETAEKIKDKKTYKKWRDDIQHSEEEGKRKRNIYHVKSRMTKARTRKQTHRRSAEKENMRRMRRNAIKEN